MEKYIFEFASCTVVTFSPTVNIHKRMDGTYHAYVNGYDLDEEKVSIYRVRYIPSMMGGGFDTEGKVLSKESFIKSMLSHSDIDEEQ